MFDVLTHVAPPCCFCCARTIFCPAPRGWYACSYEVNDIGKYLRTFDVIGSDPYPWMSPSKGAADGVASWINTTRVQTDFARPVWEVTQVGRLTG